MRLEVLGAASPVQAARQHGERLRPRQPRETHPAHRAKRDHHIADAGPQHAGQRDGEQGARKRHEDIDYPRYEQVEQAAKARARHTGQHAHSACAEGDGEAYAERYPGPRDQPRARPTSTNGSQCVGIAAWKNATEKPVAARVVSTGEDMRREKAAPAWADCRRQT